jgi:hypothetical protein
MSLEGKSVEDLQAELAKEETALAALGPISSPNTEMKRPVVQHHEQRIIALKEAIASKGSSWYNPFSWGKKGGRRSRVRGGGWSMGSMIIPGVYENTKYAGAGMDCAGAPVRAGFLQSVPSGGLPYGASGGKRSGRMSHRSRGRSGKRSTRHHSARRLRSRKSRGGANPASMYANHTISMPGVQIPLGAHTANQVQKGGRYEMNMGPLVSGSDIGMRGMGMAHRIPCEQGTMNSLNQRGGAFPAVQVGAADMMRYEAPTAGYSNLATPLPAGGASPGFLTQVPYEARSMSSACLKTGGKRSKRNKRSKRSKRSKRHYRK